jgi:tetratricopeptide (TPR) repeat protein
VPFYLYSQNLDSLKRYLYQAKPGVRIEIFRELADKYAEINNDSCFIYSDSLLVYANKLNNPSLEAEAFIYKGKLLRNKSVFIQALEYFEKAHEISKLLKNDEKIAESLNHIAIVYEMTNEYDKALSTWQEALKIDEKISNHEGLAKIYGNIGTLYFNLENYSNSITYYHKSLEENQKGDYKKGIAGSLNNLGMVYYELEEYDQALKFYNQSFEIKQQLSDYSGVSTTYNNIGNIHYKRGKLKLALEYFMKSLKINRNENNKRGQANTLENIAAIYVEMKNFSKALDYCNQSLELATLSGYSTQILSCYERTAQINFQMNDLQNAYLNYRRFVKLKDSLFKVERYEKITKIEAEYKNEKDRQKIELLSKDKSLRELVVIKQRNTIYSLAAISILIIALTILVFARLQIKRKANALLVKQNVEINRQKEEIEKQRDEIEKQRDIATRQRDQITQQQREIIDSINYASYIQSAILPSVNILENNLSESFIFYLPRDIVGGDFYWIKKTRDFLFVACGDCTGHGVPGGFLSMLGTAYLNEIVNTRCHQSNDTVKANEILETLRDTFMSSLNQAEKKEKSLDGMDIAFLIINNSSDYMQYSGANISLNFIRNNQFIEYKADKLPIGFHPHSTRRFTNHKIPILKNDCLYIFSDGYGDQFGGVEGKKFTKRKFKELLLEIHPKSMTEQKAIIESNFYSWKKDFFQNDDILVMGLKI